SHDETVRILQGLRSKYGDHHRVEYTDEALEAAAKLAGRHLRDYRLPDSAIDVLDEAGSVARLKKRTTVGAHEIEEIVARAARIPARQASLSDKERLRTIGESLE